VYDRRPERFIITPTRASRRLARDAEREGRREGRARAGHVRGRVQERVGLLLCVRGPRVAVAFVVVLAGWRDRAPISFISRRLDPTSSDLLVRVPPAAMQYQMTLYYRYGELDSCSGRWEAVMACMDKDKRCASLVTRSVSSLGWN